MASPLPNRHVNLIGRLPNLSLHFDRGYAGYDAKWQHTKPDLKKGIVEGRTSFLRTFAGRFNDPNEYVPFTTRREAALACENATRVDLTSSAPLVVGLGRWNPTECGFNFDRFTGCPFIPGSTVKGLLREAARLVAAGELSEQPSETVAYWNQHRTTMFGRGTETDSSGAADQAGSVRFFDAYPVGWPHLELDVMTPHYGKYYSGREPVAADWEDPVPVHFLRVPAQTKVRFWFAPLRQPALDDDLKHHLAALLKVALDWIGIGAKTSSGYGWFADPGTYENTAVAGTTTSPTNVDKGPKEQRLEWNGAVLQLDRGSGTLYAIHAGLKAYAKAKDVEALVSADVLARLQERKPKRPVTATVIVIEFGSDRKIAEVRP